MKPAYDFETRYTCTAGDETLGYRPVLIPFGRDMEIELLQLSAINSSRGFCYLELGFTNKWGGVSQGSWKILKSGHSSRIGEWLTYSGPVNVKADGLVVYIRPVVALDVLVVTGEHREL